VNAGADQRRSLALIAGNSGWNLLAFLLGIAANLVALPFVIRHIGISQFGICGLLLALATPLTLIGTTLGLSTAQALARLRSQSDARAVTDFCATITAIGLVVVGVTGIALALIAPLIARALYPGYQPVMHSIGLISATMACGWIAQQLSLLMQGVHVAAQAYRRIATINGFGAVAAPLLIFVIVSAMPDVEGYILALALGYGLITLFWLMSTASSFRWSLVRPRVHRVATRSIAVFTGWQTLGQIAANVANQIDRYLLGAWVGPNAVGYYNVSQRLQEVSYIGVLKAGEALFPQFSISSAESVERQAKLFFRASWMVNLVAAMLMAPLLPWAHSLLSVWVGSASAQYAAPVLQVLTVGGLFSCAGWVFSLYALGIAKARYTAMLSISGAFITALASAFLIHRFGMRAAGVGGVIGMFVNLAPMLWLIRRHFGQIAGLGRVCVAVLLPVCTALAVAGGLAAIGVPTQNSWPRVIIGYFATSIAVMAAVVLLTALTRQGQDSLSDLRRLLRMPFAWVADVILAG
jgi:O-antigen/teichoic acid export membrane protein